jgi:predicted metal-dependent phosphoesterase TrpH
MTSIGRLLRFAKRAALDFMVLTDHDTIRGAGALRERAEAAGLPLEVPLAAEYRTDQGDFIAAFIEREVLARDVEGFVAEVRGQGGLLLLPHPFVGHADPDRLARHADLVEVFNGRAGPKANEGARALALRCGKRAYFSSDAHLAASLGRVVLSVRRSGTLKESLLQGPIEALSCRDAHPSDVFLSQVIKAVKTRDLTRAVRFGLRPLRKLTLSARHRK